MSMKATQLPQDTVLAEHELITAAMNGDNASFLADDNANNSSGPVAAVPGVSKTTLFLIRHGETDWNLAGKLQGHTDIPLNMAGKIQAQKVAHFLKQKKVSLAALYSSDLQRAHQTAQQIAELFSLEIILSSDLREGHLGELEGLTKKEYRELYGPVDYKNFPEVTGVEPRHKVVARVMSYLDAIVQNHKGQQIAVVTHGGLLRSLLAHLGHKVEELPELTNVSIATFIWHHDRNTLALESIEHA